ncbi:MAG: hypothetical protein EXS35_06250 [Pedosphaera sp.]|nr:hypothetical protein [Pedosphaera sp.]
MAVEMKLIRSGKTFTDSQGAVGEWAELWVGANRYDALERAGGYVRLRSGKTYEVKCYKSSRLGQVLSPVHEIRNQKGEIARIRIHAASYPHHLAGCIAPGRRNGNANVLSDSKASLLHIFSLLGGWEDGKSVGNITIS